MSRIKRTEEHATMPVIGQLKIGEKVEGKDYPRSLDYFKATGDFAAQFHKQFGDQPTSLMLVFMSDHIDQVCDERYELWKGPKRWGRGDGETFEIWTPSKDEYVTKTTSEDPNLMEKAASHVGEPWKARLTLRFFLVEMRAALGLWEFSTGGEATSIKKIVASFDKVFELAGRVAGIPFQLSVKMVTSKKPGSQSKYPVVDLVGLLGQDSLEKVAALPDGVKTLLTESAIEAASQKALPAGTQQELPSGG